MMVPVLPLPELQWMITILSESAKIYENKEYKFVLTF